MRCMCMILRNTKALSKCVAVLLLFWACAGTACAREKSYSYQLDDTLRIYDREKLVMEAPKYLVQQSPLAFAWKGGDGFCCYIKESHKLMRKLEWAYTNDYGIVIKTKSYFKTFDRNLRPARSRILCDYMIPLPFGSCALQFVGDDFAMSNVIQFSNHEQVTIAGNISCFDGGVLFINGEKNVELLRADGSSVKTEARDFSGSGGYVWLFYEDQTALFDADLHFLCGLDRKFEPATDFIDGKAVMLDRSTGRVYCFDLLTRELSDIPGKPDSSSFPELF